MLDDFWFGLSKNMSSKTAAETTSSVKDILINQLQIDIDELNLKLDKVHRLALNYTKTELKKTVPNVLCCFKSYSFSIKLYAKQKMIY